MHATHLARCAGLSDNALNGLPTVDFGAQGATRYLQWSEEIANYPSCFLGHRQSGKRRQPAGAQPDGYGG